MVWAATVPLTHTGAQHMTRSFNIRVTPAFHKHSLRASFLPPRFYTTSPAFMWSHGGAILVWRSGRNAL